VISAPSIEEVIDSLLEDETMVVRSSRLTAIAQFLRSTDGRRHAPVRVVTRGEIDGRKRASLRRWRIEGTPVMIAASSPTGPLAACSTHWRSARAVKAARRRFSFTSFTAASATARPVKSTWVILVEDASRSAQRGGRWWAGERLVPHKLRFHPHFVAPFTRTRTRDKV